MTNESMGEGDLVRILPSTIVATVRRLGHHQVVVYVDENSAWSLRLLPAELTYPRDRLEPL